MHRRTAAQILALAIILFLPAASQANMAPPIGYRLGITVEKMQEGPRVVSVGKGSAAERAGLQAGDVILGVEDRYAKTFSDSELKAFTDDMHSWPVKLILARGDQIVTLRVPS